MAKKNFATAPKPTGQPSDDQIAAFERGGAGHDTQTSRNTTAGIKTEPTKRLSLDLPQSLHIRFKTVCSATSRKMAKELQTFIEARTAELEDEIGISHK